MVGFGSQKWTRKIKETIWVNCVHKFYFLYFVESMDRNGRLKTVLMFAQAVYLLFAAVYVCKETVEHILLSLGEGNGEGHHHHDDAFGMRYVSLFIL